MKTTVELPNALVDEIERRAALEGRDLKEVVVDLLAAGMASLEKAIPEDSQAVGKNLPLIKVRPAQPLDASKMTTREWCDWLKDMDLQLGNLLVLDSQ